MEVGERISIIYTLWIVTSLTPSTELLKRKELYFSVI